MKKEYDEVVAEIARLQARKAELEKLMLESADSFIDKFRLWYHSENECHHSWMLDEDDFPLLYKEFRKRVDPPRRGKTYTIEYLIGHDEESFHDVVSPNDTFEDFESDEYEIFLKEYLLEWQPLMEEAMNGDMKSFEADW